MEPTKDLSPSLLAKVAFHSKSARLIQLADTAHHRTDVFLIHRYAGCLLQLVDGPSDQFLAADESERSSFIQALKGGRELGNTFGNTAISRQGRNALIAFGGRVEGAFQPQWIIWVIRLTSPHLPY